MNFIQKSAASIFLCGFIALMAWGCGEQKQDASSNDALNVEQEIPVLPILESDQPAASGSGSVQGTVKFLGEVPTKVEINTSADPVCAAQHTEPLMSEDLLVGHQQTLQNVFVYVQKGLEGKGFSVPSASATLDQKGCQYTPHVQGVQVGQSLQILNSDSTLHNVHGIGAQNAEFNLGMPIAGMKLNRKFDKPEIMVKMKCDVHPWMSAYIGVLPHPFFGVTNPEGKFEIKDLPAGSYTLAFWHEKLGEKSQSINVADGQSVEVNIEF